jgi:hypothetical protein
MDPYRISIIGNIISGRTEAEISIAATDELAGIVYESDSGWCFEPNGTIGSSSALDDAIASAPAALGDDVNRRGENAPEGLTAAGFSFWLLVKSDGTSIGAPVRED